MKYTKCCIGKLLESAMKSSKFTTAKIAEMSGINKGTIENWLYGNVMPSIENVEKIFNALGYEIVIRKISEEEK